MLVNCFSVIVQYYVGDQNSGFCDEQYLQILYKCYQVNICVVILCYSDYCCCVVRRGVLGIGIFR